eukprot:jgi/Bigna1/139559/aug1.51_g14267
MGSDSSEKVSAMHAEGKYEAALQVAEESHSLIIENYGEEHTFCASIINNKALILKQLGKLEEASRLYSKALAIYVLGVGTEHPSYATALHNKAFVERLQGNVEEGVRLFSKALDIRRKALGPECAVRFFPALFPQHSDVAVTMHNLGSCSRELGNLEKAKDLQEQALLILRRRLGTEHLITAGCMNALGLTLKQTEDYDGAVNMYANALGVQQRALGVRHPDVITTMHNLAECYSGSGDSEKPLGMTKA